MSNKLDLVLLLGGSGSRLNITGNDNKHLVNVNGRPLLEHTKDKIDEYESNVQPFANKYVITNGYGLDKIMPILGEGYIYKYQSKADGLLDAAHRANPSNKFLLHLGDQLYDDKLEDFITTDFNRAKVWLKKSNRCRYHNTALMTSDKYIKRFIEKPNYGSEINGFVATGLYMLDPSLFGMIPDLPRNIKGETNLADVLNVAMEDRYSNISYSIMKGKWYDVGTHEILDEVNE